MHNIEAVSALAQVVAHINVSFSSRQTKKLTNKGIIPNPAVAPAEKLAKAAQCEFQLQKSVPRITTSNSHELCSEALFRDP